jgi:uncharacterized protein (TIGR02646 family)
MIKLRKKNLPTALRQKLKVLQDPIDALMLYQDKVETAADVWNKKDAKAFQAVRGILEEMCPGVHRCVYCEDARGDDIEHFHPKKFYPEMTFVWENYLLACSVCNSNFKRDKFAIVDTTGQRHDLHRVKNAPVIAPPQGAPLLINPRYDNPIEYLQIDIARKFYIYPRLHLTGFDLERAKYTIETFQLNDRPELPRWRETAFRNFIGWIDTYAVHKADNDHKALKIHASALAKYSHLSVWEEIRRVYLSRIPATWEKLKARSERIRAIDRRFNAYPELLDITFIR